MSELLFALKTLVQPGPCWVIERKKAVRGRWCVSVVFPLQITGSTLEFYLAEEQRIMDNSCEFEAMRLMFFDGSQQHEVAGVELTPHERKRGSKRQFFSLKTWRHLVQKGSK